MSNRFVWEPDEIIVTQPDEDIPSGQSFEPVPAVNALQMQEERNVTAQEASLKNAIVNVQEELVLAVINHITKNVFTEQKEIVEQEERDQAERDLIIAISLFYGIIIPLQAHSVLRRRMAEFGKAAAFEITPEIQRYIDLASTRAAQSHTNTILEDLLTATRTATYVGGSSEIESTIKSVYPEATTPEIVEIVRRAALSNKMQSDIASAIHTAYEKVKQPELLAAVRAAALKGASEQELIQFIKAQYATISTTRAQTIARTETNRAFTNAQYIADQQFLKQNGLTGRAYKKWVTRSDNPCPFCQSKAAEPPIPFDKPFGEVGDIWSATFTHKDGTTSVKKLPITYETIQAGNAHVNCFCVYQLIIL